MDLVIFNPKSTRQRSLAYSLQQVLDNLTTIQSCVELLHFAHFHHVSLVQWTYHLCPTTGGRGLRPVVQHTLGWDYLLALSCYSGDPNVIPDHRLQ
jgi:hypothetical protein